MKPHSHSHSGRAGRLFQTTPVIFTQGRKGRQRTIHTYTFSYRVVRENSRLLKPRCIAIQWLSKSAGAFKLEPMEQPICDLNRANHFSDGPFLHVRITRLALVHDVTFISRLRLLCTTKTDGEGGECSVTNETGRM